MPDAVLNKTAFNSRLSLLRYRISDGLQPPERMILALLRPELPAMRMLDIGIGAGRTTRHFAPLVRAYTGVDYTDRMVLASRQRFPQLAGSIHVADVRRMEAFPDGSFDFVLASFNLLDCLPMDDREGALRELRRVAAPGARICLSVHNLRWLDPVLLPRPLPPPERLLRRCYDLLTMTLLNGRDVMRELPQRSHQVLRESNGYSICWLRPSFQLAQLERLGFRDIRAFGLQRGEEIPLHGLDERLDAWIYFLCTR